jgi:Arc/MetJ-type ribon-helix-helix transcriptional regulator
MAYMGKLIMLRDEDDARIATLKRRLKAKSKAEVVRQGLDLLERQQARAAKIAQWKRAAAIVMANGSSREFQEEFGADIRDRLARLP